jgi:hypothetical protein
MESCLNMICKKSPLIDTFSIISYIKQGVNRHISKRAKNNKRDEKAFKKFQDEEQI